MIHFCKEASFQICMKPNAVLSILPLERQREKNQENLSSFSSIFITVNMQNLN